VMQIAAVQALPDPLFTAGKASSSQHIICQFPEHLLVMPFGDTDGIQGFSRPLEILLTGDAGETLIHRAMHVQFEFGRG